jgi:Leucine-rich repeat (LRR) protein
MNYCPNNTLTHYTTKLPKITDLEGAWEIGLAEIQYPHSRHSVKNNDAWLMVHYYKESELQTHLVLLPDGYYSSANRIPHREEKAHEGTWVSTKSIIKSI